jgi:hypothetical protein
MAEIGQSLAEIAEIPCKNFARETVRILLSHPKGALHSGSLKTTGGNAGNTGNAQTSRQASAGSDSDHEAAIART